MSIVFLEDNIDTLKNVDIFIDKRIGILSTHLSIFCEVKVKESELTRLSETRSPSVGVVILATHPQS